MTHKIYISQPIPENALKILRDGGLEVETNTDNRVLEKSELMQAIQGKDGLLSLLTDTVDAEVLSANPNLKIVSNYAVGYNNIDVQAATERNILVTNTPGVLTETTADLAFALLMASARKLLEADKFTRAGKFHKWEPLGFLGQDIHGATLGIVGAGKIGTATARKGHKGFGMRILYFDPNENDYLNNELQATKVSLEELLQESDFVSLHVPLIEKTHHLIGAQELSLMKPTAYLINTARGPVVDEATLAEALQKGTIAGAGLDVYENEPDVHPDLLNLDNVILAPHIASASIHTRQEMARIAAENIVAFFEGEDIPSPVNPEILSHS
ncbi:D-glycerate dehydrogenase [Candidatus Gracilibacteria bacterium]|nr:D-glycerate dehydrogenase [Candidatus Gracilibacteria bacterium]